MNRYHHCGVVPNQPRHRRKDDSFVYRLALIRSYHWLIVCSTYYMNKYQLTWRGLLYNAFSLGKVHRVGGRAINGTCVGSLTPISE